MTTSRRLLASGVLLAAVAALAASLAAAFAGRP
jgi:hypothetical protein